MVLSQASTLPYKIKRPAKAPMANHRHVYVPFRQTRNFWLAWFEGVIQALGLAFSLLIYIKLLVLLARVLVCRKIEGLNWLSLWKEGLIHREMLFHKVKPLSMLS